MRRGFVSTSLLALIATVLTVGVCQADITYNVNLPIGASQVTGTIVTDGNLGVLGFNDIVNFALTFTGAESGVDPAGPPNVDVTGSALTATASQLLFDFGGSGFLYLDDINNDFPRFVACAPDETQFCLGVGLWDGVFAPETGTQAIGTAASVPEPSSLLSLSIGVLVLAGSLRRKRFF